ncbi:ABC transporter ATP-binding protein [Mesorhizobium sp. M4B.F.Ca.ET.190.01.1.1]|uniref:ABC transporter ATP-binding protein n=2 Tax=Mesorhizobium TaxID=68287 RepID=UPI001091AF3E|nr:MULTISPECIES: ABC transporter ATP-binding protein [unclassified Mesorhizobium]TGR10531.1 ABC transporter ATP-binding protein [Mesorhizobium sp. M4B.F.Ca.ET.200.01.1.1]TGS19621.1 ABC transporter ATP-binding protein [Mesorhizobium sp. M4B.F.Ca.ET.190.01.1.1]TGT32413.1 ABC transporter ATP-binding protein [Mesorhizobium sp. M4B.F.Ca.ET.172.01.1.1]
MGSAVEFVELGKTYGAHVALSPTSFLIEPGEFFSIIGPSGSGKSTMLGVTAGFISASKGAVVIDGKNIVSVPPYRRNIGMVFQNYALFPFLTVAENIAFPLRMRGIPRADREVRVRKLMDAVRLGALQDRYPAMLSGGQQQRVALARAAVYDPAILLMDEPLGALDKNLREEMQEEIRGFQASIGATVMYVTHDQNEATSMARRIAIMSTGKIEQIGAPEQLYLDPTNAFVASFLGEANLLEIKSTSLSKERTTMVLLEGGFEVATKTPKDGRAPTFLLVRPENIKVSRSGGDENSALKGYVREVIYAAGTVKYKVSVGPLNINARIMGEEMFPLFCVGEEIQVWWAPSASSLVAA